MAKTGVPTEQSEHNAISLHDTRPHAATLDSRLTANVRVAGLEIGSTVAVGTDLGEVAPTTRRHERR